MRKMLSFIPVGVIVALTLCAPSALATGRGRIAANHGVFKTPRGVGVYFCGLVDEPGTFVGVDCESYRATPLLQQKATLDAKGHAVLCRDHGRNNSRCKIGNPGEEPVRTLGYGRQIRVGRFRCQVLHAGVECTVASTGKGFLMNRDKLVPVGGATVSTPPLQLGNFLSPDRKVWCGLHEGLGFCGTGLANFHQTYPAGLAELEAGGKVKICFYANESEAPLFHGSHQGCLQNWDEKAPVLRYGQETEVGGVLCTSATNGITCMVNTGAGRGKGFRVNANEAVQVG